MNNRVDYFVNCLSAFFLWRSYYRYIQLINKQTFLSSSSISIVFVSIVRVFAHYQLVNERHELYLLRAHYTLEFVFGLFVVATTQVLL